MKKLIKKNWSEIIKLLIVFVFLAYVSISISNLLRTEEIQTKITNAGIVGPLIVILYIVASHVFAPVAGTPGTVVAFAAYGLFGGWIILYVASLISSIINFYISRELGRKWVSRFAGEESLAKIDNFSDIMGIKLLKLARVFGAPLFEFISYAAGFTRISFKRYFLITSLYSVLPGVLFAFAAYYSLSSAFYLTLYFASMFIVGAIFTWYTLQQYLKLKN
jgi:uncharacterized membrane protein YdjX (TVP38/TMEM64 family)